MPASTQKLSGQVALVTGASKGIGAAIAKGLAAEGAAVVVNYASSREGADRVVAAITKTGGKAVAVQADLAKKADIERLFTETKNAFGRLDILINNAGMYAVTPVGTITEEIFHQHFNLNVLGLILASQEAVNYFGPEGGVIVNLSSIVASLSPAGTSVYNATKGAVDAVTRTLARELAPQKIRVNSVNPGLISTEGTHAVGFVKDGAAVRTSTRLGQPEDIASIVVFLASPDSKWINGQTHYATGDLV
jgi:3-oxoacyl-[acyl-carrier protein] reductase